MTAFAVVAVAVVTGEVDVEQLVVDPPHPAVLDRQVPAAPYVVPLHGGREVERSGQRRAPVDQLIVGAGLGAGGIGAVDVVQADPTDVADRTAVQVEPAEAESRFGGSQLCEPLSGVLVHRVGVEPFLPRFARGRGGLGEQFGRVPARGIEACVHPINRGLILN